MHAVQVRSLGVGGGLVGIFPATYTQGKSDVPYGGVFACFSQDGVTWSSPKQVRGQQQFPAVARPLLHATLSSLRTHQMIVYTTLGIAESELSNAVTTSAWMPHSGNWLGFRSELESAGMSTARVRDPFKMMRELVTCGMACPQG